MEKITKEEINTAIQYIKKLYEEARNEGNLSKVATLKYTILPILENELKKYGK